MPKRIQVVVEVADGEVIGARSTRENVEVVFVDYSKSGHTHEDQDCLISRHEADEDPEGVQSFIDATDPDEAEVD